jgi:hypothetical protein
MNWAPDPFYLPVTTHFKEFYRKIMVAEEVFVNCYSFNPVAKLEKGYFQDTSYLIKLSGAGIIPISDNLSRVSAL